MMKKFLLFMVMAVFSIAVIPACSDDDEKKEEIIDSDAFSETSIEANKATVESAGLNVLDGCEEMKNEEAVKISEYLVSLSLPFDEEDGTETISISPVSALAKFGKTKNVEQFISNLKEGEEDNSPEELFDDKGVYSYNTTTEEWDFTAGGDVVIFEFPASETSQTNNASVTISKFDFSESYAPQDIEVEMKKDGTTIMNFTLTNTFSGNDYAPSSSSVELELTDYKLVVIEQLVNNASFSSELSLSKGSDEIININLNGEGDFSYLEDTEAPEEVVDTVSLRFDIGGQVYVKANSSIEDIAAGELTISDKYDALPDTYANRLACENEMVELVNANTDMALHLSADGKIIAKMEFYVVEEEDEHIAVKVRMVFADDSKTDSEVYFDTLIEDFTTNILGL